jgi:hypothetical protein
VGTLKLKPSCKWDGHWNNFVALLNKDGEAPMMQWVMTNQDEQQDGIAGPKLYPRMSCYVIVDAFGAMAGIALKLKSSVSSKVASSPAQ